jgi:hypothetical protein
VPKCNVSAVRAHLAAWVVTVEFPSLDLVLSAGGMMMADDDPTTKVVERFEVFTGAGRRREWPPRIKAAIVAESYAGLESVSAVARRHGLDPSQLFAWRNRIANAR